MQSADDATRTNKLRRTVRRIIVANNLSALRRRGEDFPLTDVCGGHQPSSKNSANSSHEVLDQRLAKFISEKLLEKRCLAFQRGTCLNSNQCFFCQKPSEMHEISEPSNASAAYKYEPAKVFGRLKFAGRYARTASFVRFAFDGNIETKDAPKNALTLLCDYWRAPKPEVVLSVIGGYHNIRMSKEMQRKIVHESIMNVIDSTNGWLITTGNNSGIAEVIAKAVAERQAMRLKNGDKGQIVCIGVAPWGNIEKRDEIERAVCASEERIPRVIYGKTEANSHTGHRARNFGVLKVRQSVLNADHTHFLLVDNGAQREYAETAAIEFRADLEKELTNNGATVITVLIEGGPTTVEQAFASVARGIPLIVLAGTGKVAKLIATLKYCYDECENKDAFKSKAFDLAQQHFFPKGSHFGDAARTWLNQSIWKLEEICKFEKMLLVEANSNSRKEFDIAILQQLVACKKISRLALAVQWNNIDIAREIVEEFDFEIECRHAELVTSIIENKVEFVRLLVECGVDMSQFLTWSTLDTLYEETEPYQGRELKLLGKTEKKKENKTSSVRNAKDCLTLSTVEQMLIQFTNCPPRYSNRSFGPLDESFDDPFHELMVYAVIFSR
uniref:TRPM SLOG domain-containing protein n=1 Tax=Ascaris lumbricoides TaxID=6252 RepID=A0A9J2PJR7_ASCLU